MKKLFALALILCSLGCFAQTGASAYAALPTDSVSGKIIYRGVVPLPGGVTPSQAFGRAKIWLADAFASKAVLADDASTGLLSGGGTVLVNGFTYLFRVRLQVESSGVRYRLDDFTFTYLDPYGRIMHGTGEEQRDSKLFMGKGTRAKMLAEMDSKVRAGIGQLATDLTGKL